MKLGHVLFIIALSAGVAFATVSFVNNKANNNVSSTPTSAKENRLEQIKRTGVLRCGYVIWPPYFTKDANTGKMAGPFYDLLEEMGRQLKLKIEWTSEVAMGQMLDLSLNRFDMICAPVAETPSRARESAFTLPIFYSPFHLFVRKDDKRFDNAYERANRPDVKIAGLEGGYSSVAAEEEFPSATKMNLPQLSSWADLYMLIVTKKADAAISDPYTFAGFAAKNPDVMRAASGKPLRVLALSMPVPADEPAFEAMVNTTLAYLHNSGFIDKTLKKYEVNAASLRPAKPYVE